MMTPLHLLHLAAPFVPAGLSGDGVAAEWQEIAFSLPSKSISFAPAAAEGRGRLNNHGYRRQQHAVSGGGGSRFLATTNGGWKSTAQTSSPIERRMVSGFSEEGEVASSSSSQSEPTAVVIPRSVNYFISRKCNYSCQFCFHTAKSYHALPLEESTEGLRMLADAGCEKINFAGGEPFLHPILLGELCRVASDELGLAVSIISNGSQITPEWMGLYAKYVDVLGVSVDSFCKETNAAIGRGGDAENGHVHRMLRVRDECSKHNVRFKLNTVINALNWEEDMNDQITALDPFRWKVFQVLLLEGENMGGEGELRDARNLCIDRSKFDAFVDRHSDRHQLIPEPNDVMQNSYLLLDEELRFLDCSGGGKVPGRSILEVGVDVALVDAGFDHNMFNERGGFFEWRRPRDE